MAAYSPYELLRTLIERVGWPTEAEKVVALESVREFESMAIFGNLAQQMRCTHPDIRTDGTCADCGKIIELGSSSPYNGYRR